MLFQNGTDADAAHGVDVMTPSMSACLHRRARAAKVLLERKASVGAVKKGEKTAVDITVEKKHNEIVMILEGKNIHRRWEYGFRTAREMALCRMCHHQVVFTSSTE